MHLVSDHQRGVERLRERDRALLSFAESVCDKLDQAAIGTRFAVVFCPDLKLYEMHAEGSTRLSRLIRNGAALVGVYSCNVGALAIYGDMQATRGARP